jgi:hypothetical protein
MHSSRYFDSMCVVRWLIAVFTLCLVLAGCSKGGGGDNSSKLPTAILPASTPASASASRTGPLTTGPNVKPGETPPNAPTQAAADTAEGAQDFAVYFFSALDWSLATTDSYLISQVSSPKCESCQTYIKTISDLSQAGGLIEGARIRVTGEHLGSGTLVPADYVVRIDITQQPGSASRPGSTPSVVSTGDAGTYDDLYVSWVQGRWLAMEIG